MGTVDTEYGYDEMFDLFRELGDVGLAIRKDVAVDMNVDVKFSSTMLFTLCRSGKVRAAEYDRVCREKIGSFIANNSDCRGLLVGLDCGGMDNNDYGLHDMICCTRLSPSADK